MPSLLNGPFYFLDFVKSDLETIFFPCIIQNLISSVQGYKTHQNQLFSDLPMFRKNDTHLK